MKQFDFTAARVSQDGELCLKVKNVPMARQFVLEMKDRVYTAEVKEYRKKRSLDANAYFWVLCDRLAAATGVPKEEIYRDAVKNIGGNSTVVDVSDEAARALCAVWRGRGLGWITEAAPGNRPGRTTVILYSGSSTYNTAQMGRLIDTIVQDCKAVGIETLTPLEIERLKEAWQ